MCAPVDTEDDILVSRLIEDRIKDISLDLTLLIRHAREMKMPAHLCNSHGIIWTLARSITNKLQSSSSPTGMRHMV